MKTKEEVRWIGVRDRAEEAIENTRTELEINRAIFELANKKLLPILV